MFAPFGIALGDYAVLRLLQDASTTSRCRRRDSAELVVRTTGGMTKILDRLERTGLVRRTRDPNDGRGVLIVLTAKGRRTCDRASAAYVAGRERILGLLDPAEGITIDASVVRLLDAFELDWNERHG
jgi:DNA-binding MarR family transcriptional regulator